MRKFLSVLLFLPFASNAQDKLNFEIGGVGAFFNYSSAGGYGGTFGINTNINKYVKVGAGFMPLSVELYKNPQLPLFADLRFRLHKTVDLMLQPGYNFFKRNEPFNIQNRQFTRTLRGSFYGAGGIAYHLSTKTKTGLFAQLKYNHFRYKVTMKEAAAASSQSPVGKFHNEAFTLGIGVRF